VFGLEWTPDSIVWTIDGVERKRHTGDGVPQVDMYVILNLAIGGNWPGAPDATTAFPAAYQIDYVRAYASTSGGGAGGGGGPGTASDGGSSVSDGGNSVSDPAGTGTGGNGGGCSVGAERAPAGILPLAAALLLRRRRRQTAAASLRGKASR